MPDDMESLQRRIAALESALARANAELERVDTKQRRCMRSNRLTMATVVAATAIVTLGAARYGLPSAMQEPQPLTVRAPFKVVDATGTEIVAVLDQGGQRGLKVRTADGVPLVLAGVQDNQSGVLVNNRAGELAGRLGDFEAEDGVFQGLIVGGGGQSGGIAGVYADEQGGHVAVETSDHSLRSELASERGYTFREGEIEKVQLGRGTEGNLALRIGSGAGSQFKLVAGLGEAPDGSGGRLILRDAAGKDAVKAAITSGGGQVVVYGTGGGQAGIATKGSVGSTFAGPIDAPVAKIGESESMAGAGHLQLAAPGGGSAVQAGFKDGGGIVVTYTPGKPAGLLKAGIKIPGFTAGSNQ